MIFFKFSHTIQKGAGKDRRKQTKDFGLNFLQDQRDRSSTRRCVAAVGTS